MNEMRLLFEQPCYELSANGRCHWRKKAALVRKVRGAAKLMTLAVKRSYYEFDGFVPVVYDVTWYYSRGVAPDEDNLVGRCKALLDGVADALGVDDRGWHLGVVSRVKVGMRDALAGRVEITLRSE